MMDSLLLPIAVPLAAGLICLLLPDRWRQTREWMAIGVAAGTLLLAWPIYAGEARSGANQLLRVDALSGFVLLATVFFSLMIAVYSRSYFSKKQGHRLYYSCLLCSLSFACGVLLAGDLLVLITCWGLLAVTLYLMIGISGPEASNAASKTLILVGGTDALLMLGTTILWFRHGSTRMDLGPVGLNSATDLIACLSFCAAAFAKAGVMPLHSWLPDSAEKSHAPVTAFLPASLDKLLGIYLLARIVTDLFQFTPAMNLLLMLCGSLTIIGAVLMALVQHDLKRLLGYHAVSQVGYMVLGIGTGTTLGLAAGLFHMLNHAIYKSCLFLAAGVVEEKTGTVDLDRLGGLATRLPVVFAASLIAALSISGVPPLNGFASKWMVYQAIIESGQASQNLWWCVWLTAAMLGSALTLASFVKVLHSVFLCKPSPEVRNREIRRTDWSMSLPMVVLASLCLLFGVFAPATAIHYFISPAVGQSLEYEGTWLASQAAALLLVVFLLGWLAYAWSNKTGKFRRVPTYVGGENLQETRIPGVAQGPQRNVEVTGVDFYQTVEQLPVLKDGFRLASNKRFDIYEAFGNATARLGNCLRAVHRGVLSTYLSWLVLGLLWILYLMMERDP